MRALVVGYGSIGSRHARILAEDHDVRIVSRRNLYDFSRSNSIEEGLNTHHPEYVVIASATDQHLADLAELTRLGYSESLLIEKPLFATFEIPPKVKVRRLAVGYNLRFHPLVRRLKELIARDDTLLSADFYVGQHIEDWRPGRDYQSSYSARLGRGGGVIRDLSHELDLAQYLFNDFAVLTASEGRRTSLHVDHPHEVRISGRSTQCDQVSVTMNCIDRPAQRWIRIRSSSATYLADLLTGELTGLSFHESYSCERDETYRLMHQNVLSETGSDFASLSDGLNVMKMISQIEQHLTLVTS